MFSIKIYYKHIKIFLVLCLILVLIKSDILNKDKYAFDRNCNKCHASSIAFTTEKTMTGWKKTVDYMRNKKKNIFSDKEAVAIKRYLKKIHASYPEKLFKTKCARCHDLAKAENLKLSPKQWHNLVLNERARAVTWIDLDEALDIAMYLSDKHETIIPQDKGRQKKELSARELSEQKCLRCHLSETVFKTKKSAREWAISTKRMKTKSPQWITAEQLQQIYCL